MNNWILVVEVASGVAIPMGLHFLASWMKDAHFKGKAETRLDHIEIDLREHREESRKDREDIWRAIDGVRASLNNGIKERLATIEAQIKEHFK